MPHCFKANTTFDSTITFPISEPSAGLPYGFHACERVQDDFTPKEDLINQVSLTEYRNCLSRGRNLRGRASGIWRRFLLTNMRNLENSSVGWQLRSKIIKYACETSLTYCIWGDTKLRETVVSSSPPVIARILGICELLLQICYNTNCCRVLTLCWSRAYCLCPAGHSFFSDSQQGNRWLPCHNKLICLDNP